MDGAARLQRWELVAEQERGAAPAVGEEVLRVEVALPLGRRRGAPALVGLREGARLAPFPLAWAEGLLLPGLQDRVVGFVLLVV